MKAVLRAALFSAASIATAAPSAAEIVIFADCPLCPEMVEIPAGSFVMGSPEGEDGRRRHEGPQRTVTIAAFAMARAETTIGAWNACANDGVCARRVDGDPLTPVTDVSHHEIVDFIGWLNSRPELEGAPYRLPSEAEWEYAARAGRQTAFPWGADAASVEICAMVNVFDLSAVESGMISPFEAVPCADGHARGAPAGAFAPNAFGLFNMVGNVAEQLEDCFASSYEGAPLDGAPRRSGCRADDLRVVRGGHFKTPVVAMRFAYRSARYETEASGGTGFRVARDSP